MPILDHNTFVNRLKGKFINTAELQSAHPDLNVRRISSNGIIEGTPKTLRSCGRSSIIMTMTATLIQSLTRRPWPLLNGCSQKRGASRRKETRR